MRAKLSGKDRKGSGRVLGRRLLLAAIDAVLLSSAYVAAFGLRLGWEEAWAKAGVLLTTLPVVLGVSLLVHYRCCLFSGILRYASVDTALAVVKSVVISTFLCGAIFLSFSWFEGVPLGVLAIHAMAAMLLVGGARLAVRARLLKRSSAPQDSSVNILLYGAGDTAELVLRSLRLSPSRSYVPVALLDDDVSVHSRRIHGVEIHGGLSALPALARSRDIRELWVCIPNLPGKRLRKVYEAASPLNIRVKILPPVVRTLQGTEIPPFHELHISDLLRRPPRCLDRERMRSWIQGRRVLITGAGGSIGSELARQVVRLGPQSLALCDASETNLFHIHHELASLGEKSLDKPYLVDVRDSPGVQRMFEDATPEVVFHAAAYKHVPLVEINPCEGTLTNVRGLRNVALASVDLGVKEFVFISTDKAVRPASVMGATKRLGEIVVQVLDREDGPTRFSAVRFGNVLGSSGSVVEIFQDQIRRGGPVTVTHRDMTRYFMLLSEAVELVIQAGSIGSGGEIFILDMGAPLRIDDMARDLIRLMGKEPEKDISVEYTGCRPGEKIHEELLIGSKDTKTCFQDIWIDGEQAPEGNWSDLCKSLDALSAIAKTGNRKRTLLQLEALVPAFEPVYSETETLLRLAREEEPAIARKVAVVDPAADSRTPQRASFSQVRSPTAS